MSQLMATVDKRTQMAGQNRMELLMFHLAGTQQLYGINVFKIREVTHCPRITVIPSSHPVVRGLADFRGETIPVIDFSMAIGGPRVTDLNNRLVVITEYNRSIQSLIVDSVERIVNLSWDKIKPPPMGSQGTLGSYLTAVTEVENRLVEIIDVEKILEEIQPSIKNVSSEFSDLQKELAGDEEQQQRFVLVADDSAVARTQVQRCLESMGMRSVAYSDGKQALDFLKEMVESGKSVDSEILMLISDVEMPAMDGYTLTTNIREDPNLKNMYVVLHTSLSGVFNNALVEKVGANAFIAKFQPDVLAGAVQKRLQEVQGK